MCPIGYCQRRRKRFLPNINVITEHKYTLTNTIFWCEKACFPLSLILHVSVHCSCAFRCSAIFSRLLYHTLFSASLHTRDSKQHPSLAWKEVTNGMLWRRKCSPRGDRFFSETLRQNLYWILTHSFVSPLFSPRFKLYMLTRDCTTCFNIFTLSLTFIPDN